jgi:competence protein ComEC
LPVAWPLELGHWVLEWLMRFLHFLDAAPLAVWRQHAPMPWTLPLAMAGVAWLLLPAGFPARWLGALLLLPMFVVEPARPAVGEARVTVLDVGQGLAVVLETHSRTLLYDTGPQYGPDADAGSRVVVPVMRGEGIARLDTMVVTHNDLDHSGGALSALAAMPVDLVLSSLVSTHPINAHAPDHQRCVAGQRWEWDGVWFEMLYPAAVDYGTTTKVNDLSCVLRMQSAHGTILLTGDIEKSAEAVLRARSTFARRRAGCSAPWQRHFFHACLRRSSRAVGYGIHRGLPQPLRPPARRRGGALHRRRQQGDAHRRDGCDYLRLHRTGYGHGRLPDFPRALLEGTMMFTGR